MLVSWEKGKEKEKEKSRKEKKEENLAVAEFGHLQLVVLLR